MIKEKERCLEHTLISRGYSFQDMYSLRVASFGFPRLTTLKVAIIDESIDLQYWTTLTSII